MFSVNLYRKEKTNLALECPTPCRLQEMLRSSKYGKEEVLGKLPSNLQDTLYSKKLSYTFLYENDTQKTTI